MSTPLSMNEIRARLAAFSERWKDACDEDAEAKSFWDALFECYGTNRRQVARFEYPIKKLDGNWGYIDVLWKGKVIVEHKSRGKNLAEAKKQAEDYMERLKPAERPRYLVTSDFAKFEIIDLHNGHEDKFTLETLADHASLLGFLGGYEPKRPSLEAPVNVEAVEKLGVLYDSMKAGGYPDHDLQAFLVRVLFCLFAEDTGVFEQESFTGIIQHRTSEDGSDLGIKLAQIFETLDSPTARRQKALDEALVGLPYVNGQLFAGRLALAATDSKMRKALLKCCDFDWSKISPAIFGSLFQGVMEPAERRALGAHYTSEENILKLIRPLFLDALRAEFAAIKSGPERGRQQKLEEFHEKIAKLKFFDPACGCGNFLIITYRELRKLETEVLKELHPSGQAVLDIADLTKVSVDQFFGIEIEEFPAQIARVAMWLMDHVANVDLGYAFGQSFTRLPLTKAANIVHGNALRIPWADVIPQSECSYILGNPPFIGHHLQTAEQKADQHSVCRNIQAAGVLDFVCNWYMKAAEFIQGTSIRCAFVSTNSITQGEQPGILWNELFNRYHLKIQFAHRTFTWASEARGMAHVHCVIIGFGLENTPSKTITDYEGGNDHPVTHEVPNISPYLIATSDTVITNRSTPICDVPSMKYGSKPTDGGNFILSEAEKDALLQSEPGAAKFVKTYLGAREVMDGQTRYCLWLVDITPQELRHLPEVQRRVEAVKVFRSESDAPTTREYASYPTLFRQIAQPRGDFIIIPRHTSENRRYIPFAYFGPENIVSDSCFFLPETTLYHFGILMSEMHMAWVSQFCGRLESRYRYSKDIVYNNYPWPKATTDQIALVERAAQAVLDARAMFLPPAGTSTLADLYDPVAMPPVLAKAHAQLDRAVEKCYRKEPFASDRERVEYLFALYEKLTAPLVAPKIKTLRRKKAAG
jgi:hypothetical protein